VLSKKSRAYRLIALFLAWSMLALTVLAPLTLSNAIGTAGLYIALGFWAGGFFLLAFVNEFVIHLRKKKRKE